MQDKIILGGGMRDDRDEINCKTDIIAPACYWKDSPELNYMKKNPLVGETYLVEITAPVTLGINMDLWLFYDSPFAVFNGYDREEDVDRANFCYGEVTKMINHNEKAAIIEFTVKKINSYHDILRTKPVNELPEFWTAPFMKSINENRYGLLEAGKYWELSFSIQGSSGQSCVFTKVGDQHIIFKVNEYLLSEEYYFGGNYLLPDVIRNKIFPVEDSPLSLE